MYIAVQYRKISSSIVARKLLTKYSIFAGNLDLAGNICPLIYWNALLFTSCLTISKAFCLSCAEIEVYHTVRHHTFSEIYICRKFYI